MFFFSHVEMLKLFGFCWDILNKKKRQHIETLQNHQVTWKTGVFNCIPLTVDHVTIFTETKCLWQKLTPSKAWVCQLSLCLQIRVHTVQLTKSVVSTCENPEMFWFFICWNVEIVLVKMLKLFDLLTYFDVAVAIF